MTVFCAILKRFSGYCILGPDDLRLGHHQAQSPTPTSLSYDAIANVIASKSAGASAFTPIQTVFVNVILDFGLKVCFMLIQ